MPKKPFTPDQVASQRERIMDMSAQVMSEVGFHHLSMRKLASELGMTASNIYNYFPNKESLLLSVRHRGFEIAFRDINNAILGASDARSAFYQFTRQLFVFAYQQPGYYQLMFQPPKLPLENISYSDRRLATVVDRFLSEWQQQAAGILSDAIPQLLEQSEVFRRQIVLGYLATTHGLIDLFIRNSIPDITGENNLIADEMIRAQVDFLYETLESRARKEYMG
ncbi:MAG: TetR/AcrR family transcriptional regulator [Oceanobacter sp.]